MEYINSLLSYILLSLSRSPIFLLSNFSSRVLNDYILLLIYNYFAAKFVVTLEFISFYTTCAFSYSFMFFSC